jgi:hypothetical protein
VCCPVLCRGEANFYLHKTPHPLQPKHSGQFNSHPHSRVPAVPFQRAQPWRPDPAGGPSTQRRPGTRAFTGGLSRVNKPPAVGQLQCAFYYSAQTTRRLTCCLALLNSACPFPTNVLNASGVTLSVTAPSAPPAVTGGRGAPVRPVTRATPTCPGVVLCQDRCGHEQLLLTLRISNPQGDTSQNQAHLCQLSQHVVGWFGGS